MYLPISWLKEYVSIREKSEKIANVFTLSGSEVERIIMGDPCLEEVIVGEVCIVEDHPKADTLRVARVNTGNDDVHTIVCGASNLKKGQKVAVALPGATLPNGIKIEVATLRGVESHGMICSEKELGLGEDHEGIMILSSKAPVGAALTSVVKGDPILDIDVTPNRGDLFSIEGLSREYAAVSGLSLKPFHSPAVSTGSEGGISLSVESPTLCPYYSAYLLEGIDNTTPTPDFIIERLKQSGMRSINTVVDVTNYLMLLTGQPMHAFDADILSTKSSKFSIDVRKAKKGEILETLDNEKRSLTENNIVITDGNIPIALAGVMGGSATGVTEKTTRVLLEVAEFDSASVRKSGRSLTMHTDSSHRFERGIDSSASLRAATLALSYFQKYAGGTAITHSVKDSRKVKDITISLQQSYVDSLVGISIPSKKIISLLSSLGFGVSLTDETYTVTVPSWRHDVFIPADIVDEIVRVYGLNNLPVSFPVVQMFPPRENTERQFIQALRLRMVSLGFHEQLSYSYYGETLRKGDSFSHFCDGRFNHITIEKPLSPEYSFLRKSIVPFILTYLASNITRQSGIESLSSFEIGKIYIPQKNDLPSEQLICTGAVSFSDDDTERHVLYAKGVVLDLFNTVGIAEDSITISSLNNGEIVFEIDGTIVAVVQHLLESHRALYKLKKPVALFEVSISRLLTIVKKPFHFQPIPQFPTVERDINIVVHPDVFWGSINKVLFHSHSLLSHVLFLNYFDISRNEKSFAFRLTFSTPDRTLTSEVVDDAIDSILKLLGDEFNAKLRA